MAEKQPDLEELARKVQAATGDGRDAALNELAEFVYLRLSACRPYYSHRLPVGLRFSDALQDALRSFLSHVDHGRDAGVSTWASLAHAFLRNKVFAGCRRANRRDRVVKSVDPSRLEHGQTLDPEVEDTPEQFINAVQGMLSEADGTAGVFRELVLNERTQKETAEIMGLSERTIGKKMESVINHLVDHLLTEGNLSDDTEEALRLVLDPRTRVRAVSQIKGDKRLTETERRVIAAAKEVGVGVSEMTRRVQRALNELAEMVRESST